MTGAWYLAAGCRPRERPPRPYPWMPVSPRPAPGQPDRPRFAARGAVGWSSLTGAELEWSASSSWTSPTVRSRIGCLCPGTRSAHLRHVLQKLGLHRRVDLTRVALQHDPGMARQLRAARCRSAAVCALARSGDRGRRDHRHPRGTAPGGPPTGCWAGRPARPGPIRLSDPCRRRRNRGRGRDRCSRLDAASATVPRRGAGGVGGVRQPYARPPAAPVAAAAGAAANPGH